MKKNRYLCFALLGVLLSSSLASCGVEKDVIELRVLNSDDYIGLDEFEYVDDNGDVHTYADVVSGFEDMMGEKGHNVRVIYDTFDTNETMLSSLKTGKTTYDLVNASDYALQKMISQGMVDPNPINFDNIPNYRDYASAYLKGQLDAITTKMPDPDHPGEYVNVHLGDYSVGYMWGTLGILYNPAKIVADAKKNKIDLEEEKVHVDMKDWNSLWDSTYYGMMSVKDSMRDTYSLGIMRAFDEEIIAAMEASGCFDMESGEYTLKEDYDEAKLAEYEQTLSSIFNRCDYDNVQIVKKELLDLKENVFGFEVDSGKEDIVKGLIGMNFAWSGDAVFSMDSAEEGENPQEVYYSLPKTGGNIWFDGWVIPRGCEHVWLVEEFLNYLYGNSKKEESESEEQREEESHEEESHEEESEDED